MVVILVFAVVLGVPLAIGLLIGWLTWGRRQRPPVESSPPEQMDHRDWLIAELQTDELRRILTTDQVDQLRARYRLDTEHATQPEVTFAPELDVQPTATTAIQPAAETAPQDMPTLAPSSSPEPEPIPDSTVDLEPSVQPSPRSPFLPTDVPERTPPPRFGKGPVTPHPRAARAPLDPAALMLYLGAFLVVAAGIVYASYNWADLASGQKLGLLIAVTIAFGATGVALLSNTRVRQAAETFIAISALLVPANAIAAWSVFDEGTASIALITLLGAVTTTIVYTAYSIRPGGRAYAYGASLGAMVSIGAAPPALGTHWGWSGPAVLLAVALVAMAHRRLPQRLGHLSTPLFHAALVALPIAACVGVSAAILETTEWLGPITLACTTLAFVALANRKPAPIWSIASTLTGIAMVTWSVAIVDPQSTWISTAVALSVAAGLIAIARFSPAWFRTRGVSFVLHAEAIVALVVAVIIPIGRENAGLITIAFIVATAISTAIPILRQSRMWLLATAAFATGAWYSLPAHLDGSDWPESGRQLYVAISVIALAIAAYVLDRWSEKTGRRRWGLAFWIVSGAVAGLHAIAIISVRFSNAETDELPIKTAILALSAYALVALVAAWSTDKAAVRALAALSLILASVVAVDALDLRPEDRVSALVLLLGALAGLLWAFARYTEAPPRAWLGPRRPTDPRFDVPILVTAAGLMLLAMMVLAFVYIVAVRAEYTPENLAGIVWTWLVYLATFTLAAAGIVAVGYRVPAPVPNPKETTGAMLLPSLPRLAMFMTAFTITLVLRMITTDLVIWTFVGFGFALTLTALPLVSRIADSPRWFPRLFATQSQLVAAGVLVVSVIANLGLTYTHDVPREAGLTAVAAAIVAVGLLGISLRTGGRGATWLGFAMASLAVIQATRATTEDDRMIMLALAVFAWVVLGAAFVLPKSPGSTDHGPRWRNAALAIGGLAVLAPATNLVRLTTSDADLQILILALISLAGLLAVEAMLRQDRLRGIIASAIGMAALLLQIGIRNPDNVLFYTIPLGLYLLAVGVVQRRQPPIRDALLTAGSGVLLVPALLLAQTEGSLGYLWLAGGISLALFLVGVVLQLRILIAAGVIGTTIIALRMLIEATLALESWITLLAVGLILLGGGTASLVWKEALLRQLERLQRSWHDMA